MSWNYSNTATFVTGTSMVTGIGHSKSERISQHFSYQGDTEACSVGGFLMCTALLSQVVS
jgi:hypothetical protein